MHVLHTDALCRAQTAHVRLICCTECTQTTDFGYGLHMEGFVYGNVFSVVIVSVFVVVVYFSIGYVLCFENVG